MNIEDQKQKAEADIAALISKKIAEIRKKSGKEVSEIEFIPNETMTGLEGYEVKIKLI
ncbi:GnsA/GnsB family addiction module toxin [Pseudescherichia sp.]|uniref:GnsA/GnsB family addiction module toxin n=1 Tax=Pseudescherichia sp. TaxID=2055881 RepID=UPI0028A25945|nr:addiction module toxin, GnsA/GnsB family [Pseudescherichia sp.]